MKKNLSILFTLFLTCFVFAKPETFLNFDYRYEMPIFDKEDLFGDNSNSFNMKFYYAFEEEFPLQVGLVASTTSLEIKGSKDESYYINTVMPVISYFHPITPRFNIRGDVMFGFCRPKFERFALPDKIDENTKIEDLEDLGIHVEPLDRTSIFEADIIAGVYISPRVILEGSVGYKNIKGLYNGLSASIGINYALQASSKKLDIEEIDAISILPVFYEYYKENPVFKINLANNDRFIIRDVSVVLKKTTYSKRLVRKFEVYIEPGDTVELQIPFSLKDKVLDLNQVHTEPIEITISYKAGSKRVSTKAMSTFTVYGKNNFIWQTEVEDNMMYNDLLTADDGKVAVFVNPNDLSSIAISHQIMNYKTGKETFDDLPYNLKAIYKTVAYLQSRNIVYQIDPNSIAYGNTNISVDYIKFPIETLTVQHGDCDDLSVLFAQLLESAGVKCAFITTPGHIFMAADSGMTLKQINTLFGNDMMFIEYEGMYYIPLETTLLDGGFEKIWTYGLNEWAENEGARDIYPLEQAWKKYKPASYAEVKNVAKLFPKGDFLQYQTIAKEDLTRIVLSTEDDYVSLSKREYMLGDLELAYKHMKQALEENPTASNYYNAALIAYRMNNILDATSFLTQGAQINSNLKGKSLYKKLIQPEEKKASEEDAEGEEKEENYEIDEEVAAEESRASKRKENFTWDDIF